MQQIKADAKKLLELKHHIDKMEKFANYFRSLEVADRYLKAIRFLRDELFEAVDV